MKHARLLTLWRASVCEILWLFELLKDYRICIEIICTENSAKKQGLLHFTIPEAYDLEAYNSGSRLGIFGTQRNQSKFTSLYGSAKS